MENKKWRLKMVPDKKDQRWKDIITGKINHQFKTVSAGMCLARVKRNIGKDINEDTISKAAEEIYDFFIKFEKILQDDIKILFN